MKKLLTVMLAALMLLGLWAPPVMAADVAPKFSEKFFPSGKANVPTDIYYQIGKDDSGRTENVYVWLTQPDDIIDIRNNKAMAILAYLSWLVLIPLFAARESKFARFHCNQGIVLAVAEIIAVIVLSILDGLPLIGWIFSIAGSLLGLVCLLFAVLGIINATNGKAKELPIIGKFKILK